MLARRTHNFVVHQNITLQNILVKFGGISRVINSQISFSTVSLESPKVSELPRKLHKSERKPLVVGINELKRRARLEKQMRLDVQEIILKPPENGLLVKRLVPVAHNVYDARTELFNCVSKVMESIPVYFCRLCEEVHVGKVPNMIRTCDGPGSPTTKEHSWVRGGTEKILPIIESFHLYDRLGRAVSHAERLQVDRVPAILELCMQAGVDISDYPMRRRAFPVYNISGRLIDFERKFPKIDLSGKDIETFGFWEKSEKPKVQSHSKNLSPNDLQGFAVNGMKAWEKMRSGALILMQKYAVQTCGFCPEMQVGPKGHRVRQCQAFKHQMRAGQHAWQEATIDDLVPPVYVWHVPDPNSDDPLLNKLKRYYGKLPAVVELFAQAGAHVGENYSAVSRADIAVPVLDEEKWAV